MRRDEQPAAAAAIPDPDAPFASLAMYPFDHLRAAWDQLYGVVARGVLGAPNELRWDIDAHDTWLLPSLTLGMTCGWPLVTELARRVRVVGTFVYAIDGEVGHTYRSVIIANRPATVDDLAGSTLAYNSTDSLSGYVSIIERLPAAESRWRGPTIETGAHVNSIDAVRDGRADIASIDALSWVQVQRVEPERLQGLVIIDRGPVVPHLPLITSLATTDEHLAEWRAALAEAVRNPILAEPLDRLLIQGFVPLDFADYEAALSPLRRIGL